MKLKASHVYAFTLILLSSLLFAFVARSSAQADIEKQVKALHAARSKSSATDNSNVAESYGYIVLYDFCSVGGNSCSDGAGTSAGLIRDSAGNLYGTAEFGGANDQGAVFELDTSGHETVIYSFCSQTNCADGDHP